MIANRELSWSDPLLDIATPLTAVLGSARMSVGELMELRRGATILLEQTVNDPVQVYAGSVEVCQGTVYAQRGHYAIRVETLNLMAVESAGGREAPARDAGGA